MIELGPDGPCSQQQNALQLFTVCMNALVVILVALLRKEQHKTDREDKPRARRRWRRKEQD